MKLEIGSVWNQSGGKYVEELVVEGLQSIEEDLADGETVLPKDGDSIIEVRIKNNVTDKWRNTTVTLRNLIADYEEGEADMSENWH